MIEKNLNCYFWVDCRIPEEGRGMSAMCEECHKTNPVGWFWEGSKRGYGPYELICDTCKKVIHAEK